MFFIPIFVREISSEFHEIFTEFMKLMAIILKFMNFDGLRAGRVESVF